MHAALQRWLNGNAVLQKPALLEQRGAMTIADVQAGPSVTEQSRLAREWVSAVWAAYRSQHDLARRWIQQALAGR